MNDQIILQVKRLYDNYSQKYDEDMLRSKINFILKELPWVTGESFRCAVDFILRDENIKKFPTLSQIRAYLPKGIENKSYSDCDRCRDGTVGVWIHKPEFNRDYCYTFRCPFCEAGRYAGSAIPLLPQEYHSMPYEKLREKNNKVAAAINQ